MAQKKKARTAAPRARRAAARAKRAPVRRRRSLPKGDSPFVKVAFGIGGALAAAYVAQMPAVVKMAPDVKIRAGVLAAVGVAGAMYGPKMLQPAFVGVGIGAGVAAVQVLLQKPSDKSAATLQGMGRLSAAQVQDIRERVRNANYSLNGVPRGVMVGTGDGGNIPNGVIVGGFSQRLPGMNQFS